MPPPLPEPRTTRSKRKVFITAVEVRRSGEDELTFAIKVAAAKTSGPAVHEALRSPMREGWVDAMASELDTIMDQSGCLKEEDIDESMPYDLIHTTMQLKVKMKDAETIEKLKARLCACGNELKFIDGDTYSPTVASLTHLLLLQIAVHDRMHLQMIDTVAAYLNQEYPADAKPLYVKLPKLVALALNRNPDQTYRVKKYIYGLPDSGRAYYEAYSKHLTENGYLKSVHDPCLFMKITSPTRRVYIWIHVDDTLVAADYPEDIERFKEDIMKRFKITVNDKVDKHLGVNIARREDGSIKLTQPKLLKMIMDEFEEDARRSRRRLSVPMKSIPKSGDDTPFDRTTYLHLLGMLNYLLRSRPDISTALSFAATKAVSPTISDYERLLDVVFYLSNTHDIGLIMHPGDPDEPLRLRCYVDASFLTHPDSRGHSGYCICLGELGSFYSKSVKQALTATSSTHAEIKALYQLTVDLIYIIDLCFELQRSIDLPAIIFEDNSPAVQLTESISAKAKKSKHFGMLVNFIKEQVLSGLVSIRKVDSADNVADMLTKPLDWSSFAPKAAHLLGLDNVEELRPT